MRLIIFVLAWVSLLASPGFPAEKLAVLDLSAKYGVDKGLADALSVVLRDEIQRVSQYEVMSKDDLVAIAERQSLQQQIGDCDDSQCLVAFGRALGTKYMVAGDISKLGETYSISLRLLDTEGKDAGVKKRVNERCKCSEEGLFSIIEAVAAKILAGYGEESSENELAAAKGGAAKMAVEQAAAVQVAAEKVAAEKVAAIEKAAAEQIAVAERGAAARSAAAREEAEQAAVIKIAAARQAAAEQIAAERAFYNKRPGSATNLGPEWSFLDTASGLNWRFFTAEKSRQEAEKICLGLPNEQGWRVPSRDQFKALVAAPSFNVPASQPARYFTAEIWDTNQKTISIENLRHKMGRVSYFDFGKKRPGTAYNFDSYAVACISQPR